MEQGLRKLKAEEKKESKVKSIDTPNPHLLPLSGSFNFDLSFSILPDVISDNTPVPFL